MKKLKFQYLQPENTHPNDGIRERYPHLCQVQHQLAVTGKQAAHICALICGHETRIFKVTRSETVIKYIVMSIHLSAYILVKYSEYNL